MSNYFSFSLHSLYVPCSCVRRCHARPPLPCSCVRRCNARPPVPCSRDRRCRARASAVAMLARPPVLCSRVSSSWWNLQLTIPFCPSRAGWGPGRPPRPEWGGTGACGARGAPPPRGGVLDPNGARGEGIAINSTKMDPKKPVQTTVLSRLSKS